MKEVVGTRFAFDIVDADQQNRVALGFYCDENLRLERKEIVQAFTQSFKNNPEAEQKIAPFALTELVAPIV